MNTLVASVGEKGQNHTLDVLRVQTLLKSKGFNPGRVDGVCSSNLLAAIRKLQSTFHPNPSGLIEPGSTTWVRLYDSSHGMAEWSGDSADWSQEKKIKSLDPQLRPKVSSVLEKLKKRGFSPQIFYGWRSVAIQLQLYSSGRSKVKFSFHNAQKPDGTPNSYAADIIDSRFAWSQQAELSGFWKALGQEARSQGLIWGGDWSSFRDVAHVQLWPNSHLNQVKLESGL